MCSFCQILNRRSLPATGSHKGTSHRMPTLLEQSWLNQALCNHKGLSTTVTHGRTIQELAHLHHLEKLSVHCGYFKLDSTTTTTTDNNIFDIASDCLRRFTVYKPLITWSRNLANKQTMNTQNMNTQIQ